MALRYITIEYAISAMVELVLKRGTDKTLLIPMSWSLDDFENNQKESYSATFVVSRPSNYTFVGMVDGDEVSNLEVGQEFHFETYHDSCWRDGINRMVRQIANELESKFDKPQDAHPFVSFGILSPRVIDGTVDTYKGYETGKAKFYIRD